MKILSFLRKFVHRFVRRIFNRSEGSEKQAVLHGHLIRPLSDKDYFVGEIVGHHWTIERIFSTGGYGDIYLARRKDGETAVVKTDQIGNETVENEIQALMALREENGFPKFYGDGMLFERKFIIMERLGDSLFSIHHRHGCQLPLTDVMKIGIQMMQRLRTIHRNGFVHRDIHPGNVLAGLKNQGDLYVVDFGLTEKLDGSEPDKIVGHRMFCSVAALEKNACGPKDDLESLIFMLVYLYYGTLPWSALVNMQIPPKNQTDTLKRMKRDISSSELCGDLSPALSESLDSIRRMRCEDRPDYKRYSSSMKKLLRRRGMSEGVPFSWEKH